VVHQEDVRLIRQPDPFHHLGIGAAPAGECWPKKNYFGLKIKHHFHAFPGLLFSVTQEIFQLFIVELVRKQARGLFVVFRQLVGQVSGKYLSFHLRKRCNHRMRKESNFSF
jgi:hypothetical protein